jgi:hypothetical protein
MNTLPITPAKGILYSGPKRQTIIPETLEKQGGGGR